MKITNLYGLPEAIYRAILNDSYSGPKHDSDTISVTSLISPLRYYLLKKRHWNEIEEDASDMLWRLMGQAMHAILERSAPRGSIVEKRIEKKFNGITISGQIDIIEGKEISDYKWTSVWQYLYSPDGGKAEHQAQLNLGNWLCGMEGINKLSIHMLLRDWSKRKAKSDPEYPQIGFASIDIPIWSDVEVEAYLLEKTEALKKYSNIPDDNLPPCTAAEMWEKPTQYAIIKKGGKRAIPGGICATMEEAEKKLCPGQEIQVRQGERTRCEEYCPVSKFCNIYKAYKENK